MSDLRISNGQSVPVPLPVRVPVPPKVEDDGAPLNPVPVPGVSQGQQRLIAVAVMLGFVVALICVLWIVLQKPEQSLPPQPPPPVDELDKAEDDAPDDPNPEVEKEYENIDSNDTIEDDHQSTNYAIIEAEKKRIQDALKKLPGFWDDIALSDNRNEGNYLENSAFLWKIKEYVAISIESFVKLNAPLREIESIEIDQSEPHNIAFLIARRGETDHDRIMTLSLKEGGLFYRWNQEVLDEKYNSSDCRQEINRICLSKLQIKIDDKNIELNVSKPISLWPPIVYTAIEFENEKDKDGYFSLWKSDEKRKEFIVDPKNDEWLFLDFNELFRGGYLPDLMDKKHEKHKPLAYAPTFSIDDFEAYCSIEGRNDLKIRMVIASQIVESGEEELNEIIKEGFDLLNELDLLYKSSRDFRRKYNLPPPPRKLREDDFKNLSLTHPARELEWQNERWQKDVEKLKDKLMEEIKKLKEKNIEWEDYPTVVRGDKEIKDFEDKIRVNEAKIEFLEKQTEYQLWKKKEEYDAMKGKISQEEKKWNDLQVKHFTIDLIKPGTWPTEIHESENRLRLFQVK